MKKIILAFFILLGFYGHAALTLVKREPFIGPGTLTSTSPGNNFSSVSGPLTMVRVGPRASAIAAPGWSADVRMSAGGSSRGTINLSGASALCGLWGVWIRIKTLPANGGYMSVLQLLNRGASNVVVDFSIDSNGIISCKPYNYSGNSPTLTGPAITPNTWVWVAIAWQIQSGSGFPYGVQCMSMPLGGSLTTWGTANGLNALDTTFSAVNVGLQTGGVGPMVRIGCPSLYSMASFSDIAYPSDVIAPVEKSNPWFVNATSGNDSNDGATAATAWRTAAKIVTESQYSGMLDSNAAGPGGGDVLTIDTSGGPLVLGTSSLTFATKGLQVTPVSGQTYISCQAEEILGNALFTATAGLTHTYQTTDTQANVVAWQADKWMWHVKSAAYGSVASITNPQTGITTNYASTGVALDAVAGSFYTNGTTLYIHPFNSTNPQTDGQVYTRSINRSGGAPAVAFTAGNYRAIGFYVRKTALVDANDNDFGAYCFEDGVSSGSGFSSSVEGGYFAYGDKHCFASTAGVTGSTLLVLNTECEQGHPYCAYGGQTPFVSYTGATTADNIHTYRGCKCLARSGLIGATTGDTVGTGGDIIYSHNNGGGTSFSSITLDNCNFATGSATMSVSTNLLVKNLSQIGLINTYCPNTTVQQSTFPSQLVIMQPGASNLTVQNCLIKPTFALSATSPVYYGFIVTGNIVIEACTFDLSALSGNAASYFLQGTIQRSGPLNLIFRNNVYLVPASENFPLLYGATSSDSLTFDHNAYNLGGGTTLVRSYVGTSTTNLTFAQWQTLGMDCSNSSLNANLLLQSDIPQSGSPLNNGGVDLGSLTDYTGTLYAHRDTMGAYQGSSAYLAPQSITGFPPLQSLYSSSPVNLPTTTSSGLAITYTLVSGPAKLSGNILTFTGDGTVILTAKQAGNSTYAPLTDTETITVTTLVTDTPTMPTWALAILAVLLGCTASRALRQA